MNPTPSVLRDVTGKLQKARREKRLRVLKWSLIGAGFLGLILSVVYVLWFSSLVVAKQVKISGTKLLTTQQVQTAAQVPMGLQLIRIDTAQIEQRVATLTPVASVKVSTSWPNTVNIVVSERIPVFQRSDSGTFSWVDANGVAFHQTKELTQGLLVVVTPTPDARLYANVAEVIMSLSDPLKARTVRLSAGSPDRIELHLEGGAKVVWGSSERSALKSQVATALLATNARTIDVSAPESPVTRR